jgi:hypothetical protein
LSFLLTVLWVGIQLPALAQAPIEANEPCLTCHSNPDLVVEFPDGSTTGAHIRAVAFDTSVHGQESMTCAGCHPGHEEFPHPAVTAASSRDFTLQLNEKCFDCHPDQADKVQDSVHAQAMADGNEKAAVCVDCHTAHATLSLREARTEIAATCRQCHASIYNEYAGSVHGKALVEENNTDVPTCIDCHGVHNVENPHTTQFRLKSPSLCGSCHANEALMSKYDIPTDVFETYVADFHGTTVTLFEKQTPDAATNKAVCYDCHGVHAILPNSDPKAMTNHQENLLKTCQKCHPDATANFPHSWTSHYQPTFEKQPLVATINLFYLIVIPATVGFMAVFVLSDAGRRVLTRRKQPPHASPPAPDSDEKAEDA